jgi:diaminohydroxyphosphoribosylaminopyrimidine deaminase/5-amino-6-(5-phosphoribosylamino)uracil reductase
MADPNPVATGGAARLREAGIEVETGLLGDEARALNPGFVSRMTRGRPWVRVKIAASLDGRSALANGQSRWITGPEARADGHAVARARMRDPDRHRHGARRRPRAHRARGVDDAPAAAHRRRPHAETPPARKVLAGGNALVVTARDVNANGPRARARSRCRTPTGASTCVR